MKRIICSFLILFSISLSAQFTDSISHKLLMIDAINRGDYAQATKEISDVNDWTYDTFLNIDSVVSYVSYVNTNKINISQDLIDSLSIYAYISLEDIAFQTADTSNYSEAITLYTTQLKYNKLLFGKYNADLPILLRSLGYLYLQQDDILQAEQYFLEALNATKNISTTEEVENYTFVLYSLYDIYKTSGNFQLAKQYIQQLLQYQKKHLGEHHPDYLNTLQNVAKLYLYFGDYENAEKYYFNLLTLRDKNKNENDIEYVITLLQIGELYYEKSNYALAEDYFLRVQKAIDLKDENYVTIYATLLNDLADLYADKGDYNLAIDCMDDALKLLKKQYGEEHSEYVLALNDLGTIYHDMGKYTEAISYYDQAISLHKKIEVKTSVYAHTLYCLGVIYIDLEDYDLANTYLQSALEIQRQLLGDTHKDYLTTLCSLAQIDMMNANLLEAEQKYKYVLKIQKKVIGENSVDYAITLGRIGHVYAYAEKYKSAKENYLRAAEIFQEMLGEKHPLYASAIASLGDLYSEVEDYSAAEEYYLTALNVTKEVFGDTHINYAEQLISLSYLYHAKRDFTNAIDRLLDALSIKKKIYGTEHPSYVENLHYLGIYYMDNGDYVSAETTLLEVLKLYNRQHPNYPFVLQQLGRTYQVLENYELSQKYFYEALNICKKGEEGYDWLLCNIGDSFYAIQDYQNAEKCYLEAISLSSTPQDTTIHLYLLETLGNLNFDMHNYVNATYYYLEALNITKSQLSQIYLSRKLGDLYSLEYNYPAAEKYFLKALALSKDFYGELDLDYIMSLQSLGTFYAVIIGNFEKAEKYLLEALSVQERAFGKKNSTYITILGYLGLLYNLTATQQHKAENYLLEALNISQQIEGKSSLQYAYSSNNLAIFYRSTGNYTLAIQYSLSAYSILKEKSADAYFVDVLNNLGIAYMNQNNYSLAEKYLLEVLDIYSSSSTITQYSYPIALNNIASLYFRKGEFLNSEKYYTKALESCKEIYGMSDFRYAQIARDFGFTYVLRRDGENAKKYLSQAIKGIKNKFGEFHTSYGELLYALASMEFLERDYKASEKYLYQVHQIFKDNFISSTDYMSESQRQAYWQSIEWFYNADCPNFIYHVHSSNPNIAKFAYNNELFRKGLLLTSSNEIRNSILNSGDTILIRQWYELKEIKQTIMTLEEKEPQAVHITAYKQQADSLEKLLTVHSSAFRQNREQWNITWESVLEHLSADEIAIEFFAAPFGDVKMYCALLLPWWTKEPILIPICEENEILSLTTKNTGDALLPNQTYDYYANGAKLKSLIWDKIFSRVIISKGMTIYFSPSDLLHQISLEALPYDEDRTMSDVYNMVRLSSTREIAMNKPQTACATSTIYGGITYDTDTTNMYNESRAYNSADLLASRSLENDTLNRGTASYLPGTRIEAERIYTLFTENNISAKLYTTSKANEESFKSLSGKHNNILHIGTHGFTWTDSTAQKQDYFTQRMQMQLLGEEHRHHGPIIDPLNRCGLLFAGANMALQGNSRHLPEGVQDGILTAKEISLMDLRDANLVVLSACETAKGDITSEGVFGLQRAFKMAGVQTIIMSLWKVSDQATQLLMTEFYNNWIGKHQSKREAFRNAQNTVRTQYEEPEFWAGFIMLD